MTLILSILDALHPLLHSLSRRQKRWIMVLVDSLIVAVSFWVALALRLGEVWPDRVLSASWWMFVILPLIGMAIFHGFGLYRFVLRSLGRHDVLALAQACALLSLMLAGIGYFITDLFLPRSTPIIFGLVVFFAMVGVRGAGRHYYHWLIDRGADKTPVIVYGAGASGIQLVAALDAAREFRPVAFLDDDRSLQGSLIAGRRVYAPSQIASLLQKFNVTDVLLALSSISRTRRKEIVEFLSRHSVKVRTIPSMVELVSGFAEIDKLREVGVHELLERETVDPIIDLFSCARGRVVMVTGAGGSIGSELCRQIAAVNPAKIVLFEVSEYALYSIEDELRSMVGFPLAIEAVLGSVCDETRLERLIQTHGVQTIFHAAAYKHVTLVEQNPFAGVRNNVFGTLAVARAAERCGVERVILVSTDKAVRPTNVMGASKRLSEFVFQHAQQRSRKTIFSMVRFGNVMGSSGSVIPRFTKQIADGGPVTVTHPEVIRYFMTIPEAAQLVIQAGSMGKGGDVFLLDMGDPVSILDLAKRMIHLSGLEVKNEGNPDGDIEIVFTGLRPGEKLYEELLVTGEALETLHPKIMRAVDVPPPTDTVETGLEMLAKAVAEEDLGVLIDILKTLVDGYGPDKELGRVDEFVQA